MVIRYRYLSKETVWLKRYNNDGNHWTPTNDLTSFIATRVLSRCQLFRHWQHCTMCGAASDDNVGIRIDLGCQCNVCAQRRTTGTGKKWSYVLSVGIFIDHQNPTLFSSWWRHQMETFSALLAICAGNSPVPGEFPTQRPVTRSFDVFFDLRLNKRLSKQSLGWWLETLSRPLWRHRNFICHQFDE